MAEWNDLNTVGILGVTTGANPTQDFTDAGYTKVTVFDKLKFVRGAIVPSIVNSNIPIPATDDFRISGTFNVEIAVNSELVLSFYIDNVKVGDEVHIQGQGVGKPVYVSGFEIASFTAGQIVDIRATNADTGTISPVFTGATLTVEHV